METIDIVGFMIVFGLIGLGIFLVISIHRNPSLDQCRTFIFYNQKHKNVNRLWSDLKKAEEAADRKAANARAKIIEKSLKKHLKKLGVSRDEGRDESI